jgi:hypothetical protein
MAKKMYALTADEMKGATKHLKDLDKLHEKNIRDGVFLNLPDKIELWDHNYALIGHAVFFDGYWTFRGITEAQREKKENHH